MVFVVFVLIIIHTTLVAWLCGEFKHNTWKSSSTFLYIFIAALLVGFELYLLRITS